MIIKAAAELARVSYWECCDDPEAFRDLAYQLGQEANKLKKERAEMEKERDELRTSLHAAYAELQDVRGEVGRLRAEAERAGKLEQARKDIEAVEMERDEALASVDATLDVLRQHEWAASRGDVASAVRAVCSTLVAVNQTANNAIAERDEAHAWKEAAEARLYGQRHAWKTAHAWKEARDEFKSALDEARAELLEREKQVERLLQELDEVRIERSKTMHARDALADQLSDALVEVGLLRQFVEDTERVAPLRVAWDQELVESWDNGAVEHVVVLLSGRLFGVFSSMEVAQQALIRSTCTYTTVEFLRCVINVEWGMV